MEPTAAASAHIATTHSDHSSVFAYLTSKHPTTRPQATFSVRTGMSARTAPMTAITMPGATTQWDRLPVLAT